MFEPINLPPTEHHQFATGHSTEFGDSAMTVAKKINDGFKHVYGVLRGLGATLADEVEYVAKEDFDALRHEFDELAAEHRNLLMMVQGLGFAGGRPQPNFRAIGKDEAIIGIDGKTVQPGSITVTDPVMVIGKLPEVTITEPVVTVTEATEQ